MKSPPFCMSRDSMKMLNKLSKARLQGTVPKGKSARLVYLSLHAGMDL